MSETNLDREVKAIQTEHPDWTFDRAFQLVIAQLQQKSSFSKTVAKSSRLCEAQDRSRLAQAESQAPAGQNDFAEQGGWQASRKRLVAELSNAARSALTAGDRERIQSWIERLNAAGSQIDYERELTNPQGVLTSARHVAAGYEGDPWYH
jgi:hypothetical protein